MAFHDQKLMALCATRDGTRARCFYGETLGLRVISDDRYALAVEAGGTMLRIQKVEHFTPHPFTVLGWQVGDIVATIVELRQRGVQFEIFGWMEQDENGIWHSPSGAQVAWFKDPDGNILSLTQFVDQRAG
jgi:catechol 2,3-dioxygenase-like lactoylglutathione lyase family enzyme